MRVFKVITVILITLMSHARAEQATPAGIIDREDVYQARIIAKPGNQIEFIIEFTEEKTEALDGDIGYADGGLIVAGVPVKIPQVGRVTTSEGTRGFLINPPDLQSAIAILEALSEQGEGAFAADSVKIQVPGFSIVTPSNPAEAIKGREFWMSYTKPSGMSRYWLTNEALTKPIVVTILHYPAPEKAKKAFEMSAWGRPQGPSSFEVSHWDAAHRWTRVGDMYLLKGDYLVGVYRVPSDFSGVELKGLLDALADSLVKSSGAGRNQP